MTAESTHHSLACARTPARSPHLRHLEHVVGLVALSVQEYEPRAREQLVTVLTPAQAAALKRATPLRAVLLGALS